MASTQRARATVEPERVARRGSPANLKRLIHKGLVLHFMVQLSLGHDADVHLSTRSMGRVHHRILYFRRNSHVRLWPTIAGESERVAHSADARPGSGRRNPPQRRHRC